MDKTKTCKKCLRELPLNNKYFEPRKDSKDGFVNQCRDCKNKRRRERYVKSDNNRSWTEDEKDILLKYYQDFPNEYIIKKFNMKRTSSQITDYANKKLGLCKNVRKNSWTKEEDDFLINNYPTGEKDYICNVLNKNWDCIRQRALSVLKLKRNCSYNSNSDGDTLKKQEWSNYEIDILTKYYPKITNKQLKENYLNEKSLNSIRLKAKELNLLKGKEYYELRKEINKNNLKNITHKKKSTKVEVECSICGKKIIIKKTRYDRNKNGFYCSKECLKQGRSIFNSGNKNPNYDNGQAWTEEMRKKASKLAVERLKDMNNITNTKPQISVNKLLDDLSIQYENEYNCVLYSIDNYLKKYNLMIEIQGNFFHCNPLFNYNNSRQEEIINKDIKKHNYIKENYNIEVLYLWEKDINEDLEKCEKLILKYINNNGKLNNYHSFNYIYKDGVLKENEDLINFYY